MTATDSQAEEKAVETNDEQKLEQAVIALDPTEREIAGGVPQAGEQAPHGRTEATSGTTNHVRRAHTGRVVARIVMDLQEDPQNPMGDHAPTAGELDMVMDRLVEIVADLNDQVDGILFGLNVVDDELKAPVFRKTDLELFKDDARLLIGLFVAERVDQFQRLGEYGPPRSPTRTSKES